MAVIGELAVNIAAHTGKFVSGLTKARRSVSRFSRNISRGLKPLSDFSSTLLGLGAAGGAAGIAVILRNTADEIDRLAKTASRLSIGTEQLGELRHAAELTGVATNTLDMGLQRMVRRVAEAAKGTGEAQDAIRELGLDARRLASLAPDQQFRQIADAMRDVDSQTERVRLAFKLFDSEGVALVNTLKGGSAALDRMAADARALGKTITEEEAAKVERFNDAITRLKTVTGSLGQRIIIDIAPAAAEVLEGLTLFLKEQRRRRGGRGPRGTTFALEEWLSQPNRMPWMMAAANALVPERLRQTSMGSAAPAHILAEHRRRGVLGPNAGTGIDERTARMDAAKAVLPFLGDVFKEATRLPGRGIELFDRATAAGASGTDALMDILRRGAASSQQAAAAVAASQRTTPEAPVQVGQNRALLANTVEGFRALRATEKPINRVADNTKTLVDQGRRQVDALGAIARVLNQPMETVGIEG